jgi:hypothetical protein
MQSIQLSQVFRLRLHVQTTLVAVIEMGALTCSWSSHSVLLPILMSLSLSSYQPLLLLSSESMPCFLVLCRGRCVGVSIGVVLVVFLGVGAGLVGDVVVGPCVVIFIVVTVGATSDNHAYMIDLRHPPVRMLRAQLRIPRRSGATCSSIHLHQGGQACCAQCRSPISKNPWS